MTIMQNSPQNSPVLPRALAATDSIAIIGAGAWGRALAAHCTRLNHAPFLWSRPLPMAPLQNRRIWVLATPAQTIGSVMEQAAPFLMPDTIIVLAAKGIDLQSGRLLSEIIAQHAALENIAILSGPSFAAELERGLPTAITLAAAHYPLAHQLADYLNGASLRPYPSSDYVGVQLGGALKNVIAIGAGMVMGAGLGENARAALISRGLAEIMRLAESLDAKRETLMGLSGLGDIVLSCTSPQSRNYAHGLALGSNLPTPNQTIEGIATAAAVMKLAARQHIDMPICEAINAVLHNNATLADTVAALLARPVKPE